MNTRSQIPRGNKLFLPKIEYAKLSEERSFREERPNVQPTLAADEKSNAVFENGEKIPLLNHDYSMGSFTRFSVLPPIKDAVRNGRRMSRSRRYSSGISFASSNGPSPNQEANKKGGDTRFHKYTEFSSVLVQQRRDTNANGNNLQVVGRPYARAKRGETRETGQRQFTARPPQRSFSSPVSSAESSCKGCQTLLRRQRSKTEGENLSIDPENSSMDALVHTCNKREEFPGQILTRMNSGNIGSQNENHAQEKYYNRQQSGRRKDSNLPSKQSGSPSLLTATFPNGRRPVSRCEISVDVNQPLTAEQQSQLVDPQHNVSLVSLRIEAPEIDSTEQSDQGDKTAIPPQGTPQIQILIDSIENAREELPQGGSEVPYTSLREKRRRSALCRNNSKQVDDFLLVHNLRDLGLL